MSNTPPSSTTPATPTFSHATSRGQSEADTIADAKLMYTAAEADAAVKKLLGAAYLTKMKADLDHVDDLVAGKTTVQHDRLAQGAHVLELAGDLLQVMQDIRDSADELPDTTRRALGRGVQWHAAEPVSLATAAHGIARFLHDHKDVATAIGLDKQHAHDLAHLADAIDHAHTTHASLKSHMKSDTVARQHLAAVLRARAHHVRLKARIAHRKDPEKLGSFDSPVPHHRIAHRTTPS